MTTADRTKGLTVPENAQPERQPEEGDIVAAFQGGFTSRMKARLLKKGITIGRLSFYDSQGQAHITEADGCPCVADARTVRLATDLERLNAGFDEPDF